MIVCQIVGLEHYSSALGLTLMFRGITSLAAPPVSNRIVLYDYLELFCLVNGRYS